MIKGTHQDSGSKLFVSRDIDINCMTDLKEVSPWKIGLK